MSAVTRMKMALVAITQHDWTQEGRTLKFEPRYDDSIPEDQRFYQFTPSGSMEVFVTNPRVLENMKLGDKFYIDFFPVVE